MKNLYLLLVLTSFSTLTIAQKTVQWASRVVRYSSQYEDDFYAAKQVLGYPNAMKGFSDSPYSWSPKEANGNREEFIHVEFGMPMQVRQFVIVESLNPGAVSKVELIDTRGKAHEVFRETAFRPAYAMSRVFSKKIPFTSYTVIGMKVYLQPSAVKGNNQIDAIAISNNEAPVNLEINTLRYSRGVDKVENLGQFINSKYSERLPIISPDGNTLYFTRKYHPENIGDADKDDIWMAKKYDDYTWGDAKNIGEPLNNELHNFVISVSPDNRRLYVASAYKRGEKDGVAVAKRKGNNWGKPETLRIENMYNKSRFAGYYVNMNGNVLLMAVERDDTEGDRDLYVSFKKNTGDWTEPRNLGKTINTVGMESSVFLAADNKTIYFSSNGFAGYGGLDMYMSRRLDESWENWSEPQNLGAEINTPGNDYNYTIPASGDYAYFSSDYMSLGQSDLFRIRLPEEARPDPVMLVDNGEIQDFEEELDGDIVVVNNDPALQKEVDDLKNRLKRLNDELTDLEEKKTAPPVAERESTRVERPIKTEKPIYKYERPSVKTDKKTTPTDPELERLKRKYNRHLENGEEADTEDVAYQEDKNTPTTPPSARKDDENEALKRKLLKLQGKLPAIEEEPSEEIPTEEPTEEVVIRKPQPPKTPTSPVQPDVDMEALKEEIREALKEELRDGVKSELKRDMIGDVRQDMEDEMRIDLEDDLKAKVEDDLKASMESEVRKKMERDVKEELKKKLKSNVEDDLRDELADEVKLEVERELRKELAAEVEKELRSEMEYRIKKEMETQIRRELETKIRAQLEEEYAEKLKNNSPAIDEPQEEPEEVFIVPLKVGEIIPMNNIFFDANETNIKPASYPELKKVVAFLEMHPNLIVEIGGHTNSWCSHEFANQLSQGRAKEVREYLAQEGISGTRIQFHGYGKTNPIADNNTVQGRKKNQRVEMKIVQILE